MPTHVPFNEWPDPQFCIQDANSRVTMMNNQLTGTLNQISVTSYTTGSRNVTAFTPSTGQLVVGDLVWFNAPAAPPLLQSALRVTSVTPTSFTVTLELYHGIPTTSSPCLVNQAQRGDVSGASGGRVTSNVLRFGNGSQWPNFWISDRPAHVSLLRGCRRVLVVRKTIAGDEYIYRQLEPEQVSTMRGASRAVGASVYVANGLGASARAFVDDGATRVYSSVTASGAVRSWLSAQKIASMAASIWQEGIVLSGPVGSTFVIGEFTSAFAGAELDDGSFSTPRAQFITSIASISPWIALNFTTPSSAGYEFVVDMKQVSNGVINEGVTILTGLIEGQSNTAGNILASRNRIVAPTLYNPVLRAPVAAPNVFGSGNPSHYAFASGNFMLDNEARMVFYSNAGGEKWGFMSWDIHGAVLYAEP